MPRCPRPVDRAISADELNTRQARSSMTSPAASTSPASTSPASTTTSLEPHDPTPDCPVLSRTRCPIHQLHCTLESSSTPRLCTLAPAPLLPSGPDRLRFLCDLPPPPAALHLALSGPRALCTIAPPASQRRRQHQHQQRQRQTTTRRLATRLRRP